MPDRTFEVLYPVAGHAAGDQVAEVQLEGCNVDALVQGGFLRDTAAAPAPLPATETPPPPDPPTGG